MPFESTSPQTRPARHPVAVRRILRLALGTALCLLLAQIVSWPLAFIAPVLTMFILALPLPAPSLKQGLIFIIALLLPMVLGTALLPFLHHARWAGILLVALALFYSFYFTARGGSPILGTFITVGLTLVVTVGSVNPTILTMLIKGLGVSALFAMLMVWVAHALLPELTLPPGKKKPPQPPAVSPTQARHNAYRSLLIVLPLALLFLFLNGSPSYTVVMIKVAALGQQASSDKSKEMGVDLLYSTLWGGLGAVIAWQMLNIWHSLTLYILLVGLAGLIFGRWIFQGSTVHPRFSMASYAYLTMLVVLGPAVATNSGDAASAFYSRLLLILGVGLYGTAAVAVFDAFRPAPAKTPDASAGTLKGT